MDFYFKNTARRVPPVEQELLTLPKHVNSPSDLHGIRDG